MSHHFLPTAPSPAVHLADQRPGQFTVTVTHQSAQTAARLFRAWTTEWDRWLAAPDSIRCTAQEGAPFFFEVLVPADSAADAQRHPHYGRFLRLLPDALVELAWVTAGTGGAETILRVQFDERAAGTIVTLRHGQFPTTESRDRHADAWPTVLAGMEASLRRNEPETHTHSPAGLAHNRSMPDAMVIPVRSYPDLDAAVEWLQQALGCRERLRIPGHRVQFTLGTGAMVAVAWDAQVQPPTGGRPPATLMVRVADVDAAFERALALGGTAIAPPTTFPYGERQATLRDPAGHGWTLSQTIADVDPASWGGVLAVTDTASPDR